MKNRGPLFANILTIFVALASLSLACGFCSILLFPSQILPTSLRPAALEIPILQTLLPPNGTPGGVVLPPLPTVPSIPSATSLPTLVLATEVPTLTEGAAEATATPLLGDSTPSDATATLTAFTTTPVVGDAPAATIADSLATATSLATAVLANTVTAPETATPAFSFSPFAFQLAPEGVQYTTHTSGCSFIGIAGHVYDLNRAAMIGSIIRVAGPDGFQEDAIAGAQPTYGAGGYEVVLGEQPFSSDNQYTVQLITIDAQPLSDVIPLKIFAECSKNLLLIDFVQVR